MISCKSVLPRAITYRADVDVCIVENYHGTDAVLFKLVELQIARYILYIPVRQPILT